MDDVLRASVPTGLGRATRLRPSVSGSPMRADSLPRAWSGRRRRGGDCGDATPPRAAAWIKGTTAPSEAKSVSQDVVRLKSPRQGDDEGKARSCGITERLREAARQQFFLEMLEQTAPVVAFPPNCENEPPRTCQPTTHAGLRIALGGRSSLGARRPGRRRSLRQGAAVLSCRRGEHSELRSWAPSSVRTGPRMSFNPPNPCGAALLRRIVSRFRQRATPVTRARENKSDDVSASLRYGRCR
jgi:hypothetical protein